MALPVNIENLINGNTVESERIEIKKGWNEESLIHTICAFANDLNNWNGGYIIIGIEENNGMPILPPEGLRQNQLDSYQKKLIELCKKIQPHYTPITEPVLFQERHILILWCPGGDQRPYTAPTTLGKKSQRTYFVRQGSQSVKANQKQIEQLIELAKKIPFDDRINHNASINDLDVNLIQGYLQKTKSKLFDDIPHISFSDLCSQMQIIKGSSEYLKPVNIGLLMFNNEPHKFFKGAYIDVILYKDNDGIEFTEKSFKGAIHVQLNNALSFIKNNVIMETVKKIQGQAEALRFFNYPYLAVEEALVNAVYHKSYEKDNQIEVHIFSNRIEIISYPGALSPVTNEALKKTRIIARNYRNRRIGDFLHDLELTEARGTGIPTIRKEMSKNGSPTPVFEMDDERNYFLTILQVHPEIVKTNQEIEILKFCTQPKSRKSILEDKLKLSNQTKNYKNNIEPLLENGLIKYTIPEKPNSNRQMYVTTERGKSVINGNKTTE